MPVENNFQHDELSRKHPGERLAITELTPGQPGSAEWIESMAGHGRSISQAGVRVTSIRYNGTIHDFVLLNAIAETPAVRSAISVANTTLRAALQK